MQLTKDKIHLSYDDVETMCGDLARRVRGDLIVGIKRGGVVPALHLSHALDLPMEVITWQTRDGVTQEADNQIVKDAVLAGKTVVFVDDINDSGRTMYEVIHAYGWSICENPDVVFASLVEKTSTKERSHVTSLSINDLKWVVFPWEEQ